MSVDIEVERVKFERAARKLNRAVNLAKSDAGKYYVHSTWLAFECWLAAKRDAERSADAGKTIGEARP